MTVLSVESMDESLETRYVSPTRLVCLGNRIEKLQGRSSTWIMLQITQINITDFFVKMVSQQNKPHGKVQYFLVRWIDDTFPPGAPLFLGNRRMPAPTCTYQKALPWPIDRSWALGFCRRFASGFYAIHGI